MAAKDVEAGRAHVLFYLQDRMTREMKHLERSVASFGRNFATLGTALAASGAGALAWPLTLSANMESTQASFETMLGSADAAKTLLDEIAKLGAETPFQFPELAEAGKKLLAFGSDASGVQNELRTIGDIASGIGAPIGEIAEIYGKARVQGRLFAEDINQLTGRGIPIIQELAKQFGVSDGEVKTLVENGQIGFKQLEQSFQSLTSEGGMFSGGMERQSKTLLGVWSTLQDTFAMAVMPIGDAAAAVLKPFAAGAIRVAEAIKTFADNNKPLMATIAKILLGLVAVGGIFAALGGAALALSTVLGGIGTVISTVVGAFSFLFSPMGLVLATIVALGVAAWAFRAQIATAFASVAEYFSPLTSAIYEIWSIFSTTFGAIVGELMSGNLSNAAGIAWLGFTAAAWQAMASMGGALDLGLQMLAQWIPGVGSLVGWLKESFGGIGQAILAGRWDLAGQIMMKKLYGVWMAGIDFLKDGWDLFVMGIQMAWRGLSDFIADVWHGAIDGIAYGLVWIMEKLGMAADGALKELEKMQAAEAKSRQSSRDGRSDLFGATAGKMMQREQKRKALQAEIGQLEQQAATAYAEAGAPTLQTVADGAKAELDAAIANAKAESNKPPPGSDPKKADQLANQSAGAGQMMGKLTSSGSFSAAAIAGGALALDGRPAEETAKNTRRLVKIAENQKQQALFST